MKTPNANTPSVPDNQDAIPVKSAEYQNFEKTLRHILTIPKTELDRRVKADKEQRQSASSPDTK